MMRTFDEFQEDHPRPKGQPRDEYEYEIRRRYRDVAIEYLRAIYADPHPNPAAFNQTVVEILSTILH